jgi:protein-S-isoprenylcysteine O-methyltransferase Ste14
VGETIVTARTPPKFATLAILLVTAVIGGGGLLTFMRFLFLGPLNLVRFDFDATQALLFDAILCLMFFLQHSAMARKSIRQRLTRTVPEKYMGAFYAIASGIAVLLLTGFWQELPESLIAAQGFLRLTLRALFFTAILNVIWVMITGFIRLFQLQPIMDELSESKSRSAVLIRHGPYRFVRHPLYFSSLLMIWSYPDLTLDRLLLNVLFTIWVIAATFLEERDLGARFGESFRIYQQEVPMLLPLPRRRSKSRRGLVS